MEASPQFKPRRGPFSGSRLLQTQPDGVLCRLALRGNAGAYEALYTRHHGALYGFVFHLLGRGASAEDAEDIAQESFSTAFSKLADRRDDGSFKSWLFTIARNRAYDQLRAGRPQMADVTELPIAAEGGPERQAESKAEMAWLMTALGDLPERQREALVMREMGGFSYGEIAEDMETTVPGVKQLINRARGSLTEAADGADLRPRKLRKELAALVPVIPIAMTSAGVTAFGVAGTSAGVAAGAGGFSAATKAAAVVLTVAAIGGGAIGLESSSDGDSQSRSEAGQTSTGQAIENLSVRDEGQHGDDGQSRGGGSSDDGDRSGSNSGSGHDDGSEGGHGDGSGDDREGSGDEGSREHDRGSSRSDSTRDDDSRDDGSDDHSGSSGSGSGDDSADEPDSHDQSGDDASGDDSGLEDHSGSGSGSEGESQASGSGDGRSLEIDVDEG